MIPTFRVPWVEVERRGLKYAREILRAADAAVFRRDELIATLRKRLAAVQALHAVTADRDAAFGDYATFDYDGEDVQGLWLLEADRPRRIATLAPSDRVFVLRRKSSVGRVAVPTVGEAPPPVSAAKAGAA
jgi:hypothetical protein